MKILMWHILGEIVRNMARFFFLPCNYSRTLYVSVKNKEVKRKNLPTSASLNMNYGTKKQKPKMQWLKVMVDQYHRRFNNGHFFSSIAVPPFCCWKIDFQKTLFGGNGWMGGDDDKNLGESFSWGTWAKYEQTKFLTHKCIFQ